MFSVKCRYKLNLVEFFLTLGNTLESIIHKILKTWFMLGWFNVINARGSLESTREAKELHAQPLAET